ncbi:mechanosensitive ion channel family protein [Sphingomonas sp. LB-2]|uniref:mechanosensitive ion channel family protein n=1 Tax=Sphingomonas caeni TaxID=2984949 RepID=UPI00222F2150|nr:mechanosensitive ion channel family protein [Sphingomonas caeni]MCW3849008.1 mechanosensitive ion channel family protein [Sphingomonas caeni]
MTNAILPSGDDIQLQARSFLTEASDWVRVHWADILLAGALAVGIFFAIHLVRAWGLRLCRRGEGAATWYSILGRALGKTNNFFIVMTSIWLVSSLANPSPSIANVIHVLSTVATVLQGAVWIRELIFGVVEHRTLDESNQNYALSSALGIIRMLVTILVFAIALVVVLSNLGVNVTGLVAGLGIGGIAIGLAAQGIFADLFAALAIIFDKPFRIGDNIAFGTSKGKVERIGLKSTRLRGPNGEERIVANKKLLDYELLNNSNREYRRITLTIRLAYSTPGEKAAMVPELVRQAVEGEKCIFGKAWLSDFAVSSIDYEIEFDSPSPSADEADEKKHKVAMAILKRFDDEGINFFAPTQAPATPPSVSP